MTCAIIRKPRRCCAPARASRSATSRSAIRAAGSVFENLNLRLMPGQRVGLVGQSGGGKSTLFGLLQRFYDVQHGGIFIDGQDIRRVTQESLRAAIAVVPQDVSLFHRSVIENIRYGRPDASDDEVLRAAQRRALPRLHRGDAAGHGHHRRRPRRETVGRAAPAHRDRARADQGRAAACCSTRPPPRSTASRRKRCARRWPI